MYIRTVIRHNKNGTTARYIQLAHNVWDPQAKRSVPQVVYSFGREEKLDKEALRRLARSINRFLGLGRRSGMRPGRRPRSYGSWAAGPWAAPGC